MPICYVFHLPTHLDQYSPTLLFLCPPRSRMEPHLHQCTHVRRPSVPMRVLYFHVRLAQKARPRMQLMHVPPLFSIPSIRAYPGVYVYVFVSKWISLFLIFQKKRKNLNVEGKFVCRSDKAVYDILCYLSLYVCIYNFSLNNIHTYIHTYPTINVC